MIVLQLKSTQNENALATISSIVKTIHSDYNYKIKGHEIQQTKQVMSSTTVNERVEMVSRFCVRNEIEYLAYHAPILGRGQNIWEERWREKYRNSISTTMAEAARVRSEAGIPGKVTVVFHLTNYLHLSKLPKTIDEKLHLFGIAESNLLESVGYQPADGCILAVENTYPRYDRDFANLGPFHPKELIRMKRHGIKTVLDIAHYHIYANYLKYGTGNAIGELDRDAYGQAPDWEECLRVLGDSLALLHISDAKGLTPEGEGLPLGKGEVPLTNILEQVGPYRIVQGTIELAAGHLDGGRSQLESSKWLLRHARHILA